MTSDQERVKFSLLTQGRPPKPGQTLRRFNVYRDVALNMNRAKGLYLVEIEMHGQVEQQRLIIAIE